MPEVEEKGHIFSYGRKCYYIYAYAVMPYGIYSVQNTLIKPVYCVKAYVICSLANFSQS